MRRIAGRVYFSFANVCFSYILLFVTCSQGQFNQRSIVELLSPYLAEPLLITKMAAKAKQQAILDATASVAMHCEQVTNKRI